MIMYYGGASREMGWKMIISELAVVWKINKFLDEPMV